MTTDGSEVDTARTLVPAGNIHGLPDDEFAADPVPRGTPKKLARPSIARLNVCSIHSNWPHSDDAQRFVEGTEETTDPERTKFRARRLKEIKAASAAVAK